MSGLWYACAPDVLAMWTIYHRPKDAPPALPFVVRRHEVGPGWTAACEAVAVATMHQARGLLPRGLRRVPRGHMDEGVVVETWV